AAEVRRLAELIDHDAAGVAAIEERISTIYSLQRRYGDDEAAVLAHGERAAAEAERLRGIEAERAARQADDARLLEGVAAVAAELSNRRAAAAGAFGAAVAD